MRIIRKAANDKGARKTANAAPLRPSHSRYSSGYKLATLRALTVSLAMHAVVDPVISISSTDTTCTSSSIPFPPSTPSSRFVPASPALLSCDTPLPAVPPPPSLSAATAAAAAASCSVAESSESACACACGCEHRLRLRLPEGVGPPLEDTEEEVSPVDTALLLLGLLRRAEPVVCPTF